jgi:hypothetical protein
MGRCLSSTGSSFAASPTKGATPTNFVSRFLIQPLKPIERSLNEIQRFVLLIGIVQPERTFEFDLLCQAVRTFMCSFLVSCSIIFDFGLIFLDRHPSTRTYFDPQSDPKSGFFKYRAVDGTTFGPWLPSLKEVLRQKYVLFLCACWV